MNVVFYVLCGVRGRSRILKRGLTWTCNVLRCKCCEMNTGWFIITIKEESFYFALLRQSGSTFSPVNDYYEMYTVGPTAVYQIRSRLNLNCEQLLLIFLQDALK